MIGSIKAAQESYRSETFAYLDVSGAHALADKDFSTFYPTTTPGSQAVQWGDAAGVPTSVPWQTLGVIADAPVRFTYGCAADAADTSVTGAGMTVGNWPEKSTQPWYVVRAVGDLDGDKTYSNFVSSSFVGQIFIDKEGE